MLAQHRLVGLVFNHGLVERIAGGFLLASVDDDGHDQSDETCCTEVIEWAVPVYVFVENGSDDGLKEDADDSEESLDACQESSRFRCRILVDKIERGGEKTGHSESQHNER